MAEEQTPVMSPEDIAAAQFQIQKLYVKDVSFELPNAPQVFQEQGQAEGATPQQATAGSLVDEHGARRQLPQLVELHGTRPRPRKSSTARSRA